VRWEMCTGESALFRWWCCWICRNYVV